jgi:solute carrier family 35 protein F5
MQVASVTILSATSSSWCLVGAFLTGKEQLNPLNPNVMIKCAAVALNLVGVAVVALADEAPGAEDGVAEASANADGGGDEHPQAEHSVLGDTVAIGSAVCYAAYTTMLEQKLGDDADADMLSLFAFLGAFYQQFGYDTIDS